MLNIEVGKQYWVKSSHDNCGRVVVLATNGTTLVCKSSTGNVLSFELDEIIGPVFKPKWWLTRLGFWISGQLGELHDHAH